jgi:hypothetical protein
MIGVTQFDEHSLSGDLQKKIESFQIQRADDTTKPPENPSPPASKTSG